MTDGAVNSQCNRQKVQIMKSLGKQTLLAMMAACGMVLGGCAGMSESQASKMAPAVAAKKLEVAYEQSGGEEGCNERAGAGDRYVDCERIQREVEKLNVIHPKNDRVLLTNAVMQVEAGSLQKAQYTLDQLLAQPGVNPEAAVLRAKLAMQEGNTTLAREVLNRQITLAPARYELREALAATMYFEGDYAGATRQVQLARRFGAPGWRAAYHEGLLFEAGGQMEVACASFRESAELAPQETRALGRIIALSENPACDMHLQEYMRGSTTP